MELEKTKARIEAILFAVGRKVSVKELVLALELPEQDIISIIESMKTEMSTPKRGIEIISVEDGYQLCTKREYYEFIYPIVDKRNKPKLSQAALETLAIVAYNPKITRAEIESIRGVNSDGTIYKLLEYHLITDVGKMDAPGRPTMYATTEEFLRMFGYKSLEELPDLPRYKLDENQQIVIEEIIEEQEAPNPEREEAVEKNVEDVCHASQEEKIEEKEEGKKEE